MLEGPLWRFSPRGRAEVATGLLRRRRHAGHRLCSALLPRLGPLLAADFAFYHYLNLLQDPILLSCTEAVGVDSYALARSRLLELQ